MKNNTPENQSIKTYLTTDFNIRIKQYPALWKPGYMINLKIVNQLYPTYSFRGFKDE